MYLITSDIEATRAELMNRGVDVSEPFHFGPKGQASGLNPERADYNSFVSFSDPDGNSWLIQESSNARRDGDGIDQQISTLVK
jgi:hypothetical protein